MKSFEVIQGADRSKGIKAVIYGVEGIGKTTLASKFPSPIFIDTEGSTSHFDDISRLPKPADWKELNEMIDYIGSKTQFKTVVIDTFDWAEQAEVEDMLKENKWRSIESPGYGKGYIQSAERILAFLKDLEKKLIDKGINIVLNCHAQIRKIELPEERGSYDKYELKLGNKTGSRTSPIVKEWADLILFCNYKTILEKTDDPNGKRKARGGTERVMYATHSAVWDAKNRFGLPDEMEMDFKEIARIFKKPEAKPQPKAEPEPAPIDEDEEKKTRVLLDSVLPKELPDEFLEFAKKNAITLDVLRFALYKNGNTKELEFDVRKIPEKFWTHFMKNYDKKYKELIIAAREDTLPF